MQKNSPSLVILAISLLALISLPGATLTLVDHGEPEWRYRKGTSAPQADWKTAVDANLDATWLGPAPGGFGYDDGDDATVLNDMAGNYTTVYIRRTFNITNSLDPYGSLQLTVDWDDGYVAWLDGVEIARDRAPGDEGTEPSFSDFATSTHSASVDGSAVANLDLGLVANRLAPGPHVLAVMGLNSDSTSSDLSLIVDLAVKEPLPPLVAVGSQWRYFKGLSAPVANWQTLTDASLGTEWLSGPGGFGYGDDDDATRLDDMRNNYTTIFIRKTFTVDTALDPRLRLQLIMDWDDGFVAYLDGIEIARDRAPGVLGDEVSHTDVAADLHEASSSSSNLPAVYHLGFAAKHLPPGAHILALIGLNESLDSSDLSLIPTLAATEGPPAEPPIVPAWSMAEFLAWNPLTDLDAPYNIGTVPLRDRINVVAALQANANARSGQGGIQSLDTLNSGTAGNPAQGDSGSRYTFTYWQYVKEMVYWGGSAGEGIVVPPSGETIDMAHRNGVPILGTIFWPPTVYGGNYQWVRDFLERNPNGSFPAGDQLIAVAEYFGFDGWFFNQETAGGSAADAAAMRDLIQYVREHSAIRIVWYDSMTESGFISWQDRFNSSNDWYLRYPENASGARIGHSIFLDFVVSGSTAASSRQHALDLGLDPYEIYAGFEMEEANFKNATGSRQNTGAVFPAGADHLLSAGFYKPSKHASSIADQDLFWSGANGDPRDTTATVDTGNWHGIAHNVAAMSPINDVSFMTSFCLGRGGDFYINGDRVSTVDWWNRALQDVLPTWRWILDSAGARLTPELYLGDGYYGGGCLRVSGNLNADNSLRLYRTALPVQSDTWIKVVYKRGVAGVDSQMWAGFSLASNPSHFIYLNAGACANAAWNVSRIPLGAYAGETIAALGLKFVATPPVPNYDIRIGQLGVYRASASQPLPASNVMVLETAPASAGKIHARVRWDHAAGKRYYYHVFDRQANGSLVYLGSTPNNYYYVRDVTERAGYPPADLVVINVGPDMEHSVEPIDEPPELMVTHEGWRVVLSWPAWATGFKLETRASLASGDWLPVSATVSLINGRNSAWMFTGSSSRFFRLKK